MAIRTFKNGERPSGADSRLATRTTRLPHGIQFQLSPPSGVVVDSVQWKADGANIVGGDRSTSPIIDNAYAGKDISVTYVSSASKLVYKVPESGIEMGQQVLPVFDIGVISFNVASLDVGIGAGGTIGWMNDIFLDEGHVCTARVDGVAGRDSAGVLAALPALLTTLSALQNPVIVFASIFGNDVSNAFNTYGRADAAPVSYWTERLNTLNQIAVLCEAAGVRPIFGNDSYRNYGLDNRCRTDQDIGSGFVNRMYLEPWIKARYPEQWDFVANRPILDEYRWSWAIADWTYTDHIHLSGTGYHMRRRFLASRIGKMAKGVMPQPISLVPWPVVPQSLVHERVLYSFSNQTAANSIPAVFNKSVSTGSGTSNRVHPAIIRDVNGIAIPGGFVRHFGAQNGLGDGRGNGSDNSPSLTNAELLKGSFYTGGAGNMYTELGGFPPNSAVRVKFNSSAAYTATADDRVTEVYASGSSVPKTQISDMAAPSEILVFEALTDPLGVVTITTRRATGGTNAFISGLEVKGRSSTPNTAPVASAAVSKGNVCVGEPIILNASELLAVISDANGDSLTVKDLSFTQGSGTITGTGPWVATASSVGDLVISYTVDDGNDGTCKGTVTLNAAANLWVEASVTTTGGSQKLGGGRYRVYSADGSLSAVQITNLLSGKNGLTYRFSVEIESFTAGTSLIMGDTLGTDITISGTGVKVGTWVVNDPTAWIKRSAGITDAIVKNVFLRAV